MNNAVYHLIVFLASLVFLGVLIVTGHDSSPLLSKLLTGAIGGTGAVAIGPAIAAFLKGPNDPTASAPVTRQGGFIRLGFLAFLLAGCFVGCASLSGGITSANTVAEACAGASASIKALTIVEQAGKLTAADKAAVDSALSVVNPLCEAPTQPTATQAELNAITSAAAQLAALQVKNHATVTGP